jgi:hypothetical protein
VLIVALELTDQTGWRFFFPHLDVCDCTGGRGGLRSSVQHYIVNIWDCLQGQLLIISLCAVRIFCCSSSHVKNLCFPLCALHIVIASKVVVGTSELRQICRFGCILSMRRPAPFNLVRLVS